MEVTDDLGGGLSDDRYCHHCREIALAYDPTADRARCRSCGELARIGGTERNESTTEC